MYKATSALHEKSFGYDVLISPHEICDSCGRNSGPAFSITALKGPLSSHRNNKISSGAEAESKLYEIHNAEAELYRLKDETDHIQHVLASFQKHRNELEEHIFQERSLIAPIRRLPEDLLQRIFLICQQDDSRDGYIDVYLPNRFTWTIMQICAYWRFVANSYPDLWCKIRILNYGPTGRANRMAGPFLEMCISLSKEMPLFIALRSPCEIPGVLGDSCLQSIADSAHRWQYIYVNDGELLNNIMSRISPEQAFPSLECLSISKLSHPFSLGSSPELHYLYVNLAQGRASENVTIALRSAPSLRELSLLMITNPTHKFVQFPYNQITNFECHLINFFNEELSFILNSMQNLTTFTLDGEQYIITCGTSVFEEALNNTGIFA